MSTGANIVTPQRMLRHQPAKKALATHTDLFDADLDGAVRRPVDTKMVLRLHCRVRTMAVAEGFEPSDGV